MNWSAAIERNQAPLLVVVAGLFAMIGLAEGGMIDRVRRPIYRKVLSLLRPAEAAVRRLIIIAALGLKVKPQATRSAGAASSGRSAAGKSKSQGTSKVKGQSHFLFRLFDPPRRISPFIGRRRPRRRGPEPRIRYLDWEHDPRNPFFPRLVIPPIPQPPARDDSVSAARLCRRLAAILDALNNLQRHAERYARWRDKPLEQRRPQREDALRTGPPPYLRRKSKHEVHAILKECHGLAYYALKLDTS